ncbi:lipopolysaccharide-induced tumor necrosis factor-alpha factor homolog [Aplochiton taeniatus]
MDYGDNPSRIRCPYCHQDITTEVEYKPGLVAWSMCLLFILLGLCLHRLICGCCLIPFLVKGFQDAHHSCPSCHSHLHKTTRK